MGPNAGGANTLEFLRNTPQVVLTILKELNEAWTLANIFELFLNPLHQFQALREMVQANPQILQVCSLSHHIFLFLCRIGIDWRALSLLAAHASRAREAKSSISEADSRPPSRLSSPDQWAHRRRWRVNLNCNNMKNMFLSLEVRF